MPSLFEIELAEAKKEILTEINRASNEGERFQVATSLYNMTLETGQEVKEGLASEDIIDAIIKMANEASDKRTKDLIAIAICSIAENYYNSPELDRQKLVLIDLIKSGRIDLFDDFDEFEKEEIENLSRRIDSEEEITTELEDSVLQDIEDYLIENDPLEKLAPVTSLSEFAIPLATRKRAESVVNNQEETTNREEQLSPISTFSQLEASLNLSMTHNEGDTKIDPINAFENDEKEIIDRKSQLNPISTLSQLKSSQDSSLTIQTSDSDESDSRVNSGDLNHLSQKMTDLETTQTIQGEELGHIKTKQERLEDKLHDLTDAKNDFQELLELRDNIEDLYTLELSNFSEPGNLKASDEEVLEMKRKVEKLTNKLSNVNLSENLNDQDLEEINFLERDEALNAYYIQVKKVFNEAFITATMSSSDHFEMQKRMEVHILTAMSSIVTVIPMASAILGAAGSAVHAQNRVKKEGEYVNLSILNKGSSIIDANNFSERFSRALTLANSDKIFEKSNQIGKKGISETLIIASKYVENSARNAISSVNRSMAHGLLGGQTSIIDDMAITDARKARDYILEGDLEKYLGKDIADQTLVINQLISVVLGQNVAKSNPDISKAKSAVIAIDTNDLPIATITNKLSGGGHLQIQDELSLKLSQQRINVDEKMAAISPQKETDIKIDNMSQVEQVDRSLDVNLSSKRAKIDGFFDKLDDNQTDTLLKSLQVILNDDQKLKDKELFKEKEKEKNLKTSDQDKRDAHATLNSAIINLLRSKAVSDILKKRDVSELLNSKDEKAEDDPAEITDSPSNSPELESKSNLVSIQLTENRLMLLQDQITEQNEKIDILRNMFVYIIEELSKTKSGSKIGR